MVVSFIDLNLYWKGMPSTGPMMFCSLPQEAVISLTASLRRSSRSLKTPLIMASGMSITRMSAPTPKSLNSVLFRRRNDCDFTSGGVDCISGMAGDWTAKVANAIKVRVFAFAGWKGRCFPRCSGR